jgi:hypothetical protein
LDFVSDLDTSIVAFSKELGFFLEDGDVVAVVFEHDAAHEAGD